MMKKCLWCNCILMENQTSEYCDDHCEEMHREEDEEDEETPND